MKKTVAAVIGVGALGRHHARIYSQLPQAELAAVVDIDAPRGQKIASQYGCPFYDHVSKLPEAVEAVSVAVPTVDHAKIAVPLLGRGIHVLVEKPIASSLTEADEMRGAAATGQARLHVGHSERFNPALRAVRPHIDQPGFFEVHRMGAFSGRSMDIDVVLDLMIHDIDLLLHLVGREISEVRAVGIPVLTDKVDIANARLQFDNGCVANVTASRISLEKIRKLRLFQPHDYISLDLAARKVEMYSLDSSQADASPSILPRLFEIDETEPLRAEIEAFLEDAPEACSGSEGRKALSLALQIREVIDRQEMVRQLTQQS
ncbi:MAG TPA: Gfo/Idh/MocA family oxidoreductase [Acidobacteriota bacterium]|nr:Gfo/Idh/MocA family oxidoreductase [Acidobacteriota bacterium]